MLLRAEIMKTHTFLILATIAILPLPTLFFGWLTNKTITDLLFY